MIAYRRPRGAASLPYGGRSRLSAHTEEELTEAFATAIRHCDAKIAWLNAVAVIGALIFADFVVANI